MVEKHPQQPLGDDQEGQEINHKLSRNVVVSILAKVFYLATRLFIPPFILSYVPLREYGIWSYCFVLISYVGMSVLGVNNVYIRYIAVYAAHDEKDKINRLVNTGLITVTTVCAIILGVIWVVLPSVFPVFNIPPDLYQMAFILMFGTIAIHIVDMTIGVFNYILQSLQEIVAERVIWTISFLIETALIIFLLIQGYGIYSLLIAFAVRTILAIILYAIVCFRKMPGLEINPKYFDRSMIRTFYHFGGIVQLSGILSVFNRSIERLFGGMFIGVSATALYDVGEKFPIMAISIPATVNKVLLPTTAHLHAKERTDHIQKVYIKGSRLINIMTGCLMGYLAAFAVPIINCWLGTEEKYAIAAVILAVFSPAYQMDVITGPISAIYRSIEKPGRELVYNLGQTILVLAAAATVFSFFGTTFNTINISVASMMILSAVIYIIIANRFLHIPQMEYFKAVIVPGFTPYVFGYLLAWLTCGWYTSLADNRWDILGYLLLTLAIYCTFTSLFIYFFMTSQEERETLKFQLIHTFKELLGR